MQRGRRPLCRIARLLLPLLAAACSGIPAHDHGHLQKDGGWCEFCGIGWAQGREFTRLCCYDACVLEGLDACPAHR